MTLSLEIKLGSIAVHADELLSPTDNPTLIAEGGHTVDRDAIKSLLSDPEVRAFLSDMEKGCFLPLRRDDVRYTL